MDAAKLREIASRGGKVAHAHGRAHAFTSYEARSAGRMGGAAVSRDRTHMAEIGRLGGLKRRKTQGGDPQTTEGGAAAE